MKSSKEYRIVAPLYMEYIVNKGYQTFVFLVKSIDDPDVFFIVTGDKILVNLNALTETTACEEITEMLFQKMIPYVEKHREDIVEMIDKGYWYKVGLEVFFS